MNNHPWTDAEKKCVCNFQEICEICKNVIPDAKTLERNQRDKHLKRIIQTLKCHIQSGGLLLVDMSLFIFVKHQGQYA